MQWQNCMNLHFKAMNGIITNTSYDERGYLYMNDKDVYFFKMHVVCILNQSTFCC